MFKALIAVPILYPYTLYLEIIDQDVKQLDCLKVHRYGETFSMTTFTAVHWLQFSVLVSSCYPSDYMLYFLTVYHKAGYQCL